MQVELDDLWLADISFAVRFFVTAIDASIIVYSHVPCSVLAPQDVIDWTPAWIALGLVLGVALVIGLGVGIHRLVTAIWNGALLATFNLLIECARSKVHTTASQKIKAR